MGKVSRRELMQMVGAGITVLPQKHLLADARRGPENDLGSTREGAPQAFRLDLSHTAGEITPLLFGHNLEHSRHAIWRGLSAQMLANRKFAAASTTDARAAAAAEGFIGALQTQGAPGADGVAVHWYGIGDGWTNFYMDEEIAYAGRTAQRLDVIENGRWGGVGQRSLDLLAGTEYEVRVVLRTHFGMRAHLRVCDGTGRLTYFEQDSAWPGNEWRTWVMSFTAVKSDPAAKLELTFEGLGTAWLGAASMLPADNFRGLRKDVIAALRDISVPVLRWPGGNFTRNWIWKEGLVPVDRRRPVISKNHETLPFTDNYDFQEIGIDDFMALCEALGAQPSLVLNITDDLQNACDLLEYCNGLPESGWGKMRAERGHPAPYGVKYWSVGNENFGYWMGPAYFPPEEYGKQVERFATALRKIDPSIEIVGNGSQQGSCEKVVAAAGKHLQLVSAHDYYVTPESDSALEGLSLELGRKATLHLRSVLADFRSEIEKGAAPGAAPLPISLDEWNIWHWWFIRPFEHKWHSGPLDGMYVASALNLLCREGQSFGVHSAMFFQPVTEGCIAVRPHAVHLTAAGQVFRLYRMHHGNLLVKTDIPQTDEDLDICASLDRRRNRLAVSVLNRNSAQSHAAELKLAGAKPGAVQARLLSTTNLSDPDAVFEERELSVDRRGATLQLRLPAYSIARIEVALDGRHSL